MDVIKNFTKKSIMRNKKRTCVTIIGVMLSTALICAVAGMVATFREGMINYLSNIYGSFHGEASDVPADVMQYVIDNAHVVKAGVSMPVGTAEIDQITGEQYICVMAFDDEAFSDVALDVIEGRLPQNDNELLITKQVRGYWKDTEGLKVGDKVTLELGRREKAGQEIAIDSPSYYWDEEDIIDEDASEESIKIIEEDSETSEENAIGERLADITPHEFTIVGVMEYPNDMVQRYNSGGYVCITGMNHGGEVITEKDDPDNNNESMANPLSLKEMMDNTFSVYRNTDVFNVNVYFTYDNPRNYISYTEEIENELDKHIDKKLSETENDGNDYNSEFYFDKNELVTILGGVGDTTTAMVAALAGIIIAIIVVTSIFVISNSFRISVAEKKVQLGMLSSVGATKRQIRKIVLKEGFYIGAAGITLGVLLGVIVVAILTVIVQKLLGGIDAITGFDFHFVFPWWVAAIAICMSAITIYFACIIPAQIAAKQSPLEAIRGNKEIKIKGNKLKTGKLTKKLFGIGGVIAAKNLKRSRRSYRTTVVSIVLGVATFIAISSFIGYVKKMAESGYESYGCDLMIDVDSSVYDGSEETFQQYMKELKTLAALPGVDNYTIPVLFTGWIPRELVKRDYQYGDGGEEYIEVAILEEDNYRDFLDRIGIKADDITKVAILEDNGVSYNDDGSMEMNNMTNIEKGDEIPLTYTYEERRYDRPHRIDKGFADDGVGYGEESMPQYTQKITITAKSDVRPTGFTFGGNKIIFVCEGFFDKPVWEGDMYSLGLYINSEKPDELEKLIYKTVEKDENLKDVSVYNVSAEEKQVNNIMLLVSIFSYGFIIVIVLIGVTNIFNTIYTNMNLRAKEFAMLKSVGMTKREFDGMVRLESIMYGTKSLLIGLPLGLALSYAIYMAVAKRVDYGYYVPVYAILLSVLFVAAVVGLTMHLSLARIRKQNIIETIRKQTY